MKKVFGLISDYSPVREEGTRVVVCYGMTAVDEQNATWFEIYLPKKQYPNVGLAEVKKAIEDHINSRTQENILNGFEYTVKHGTDKGTTVNTWLSKENQENMTKLAASASALTFPVVYKIGEQEDGTPVSESFSKAEELQAFSDDITKHFLQCLQDGWAEKKNFDWSPYEALYPQPENTSAE